MKQVIKKIKIRTFDFVKEDTGRWYVVLPEWEGPKEALEMVLGADSMLDMMSGNENKIVTLKISEKPFTGSDRLDLTNINDSGGGGAFYRATKFEGKNINMDIWLCDVMHFVFGGFPKRIYVRNIKKMKIGTTTSVEL